MSAWLNKLADRMLELLFPVCLFVGIPILIFIVILNLFLVFAHCIGVFNV